VNELAIIDESWYRTLIEELKDIIVEGEFCWRMRILETYHDLGKRILEENANFERAKIYGEGL